MAAIVAALSTVLLTAGANSATAAPAGPGAGPTPTQQLVRSWAAAGRPSGGGTLSSSEGQQLELALQGKQVGAATAAPGVAQAFPPCQGTFPSNGVADIVVQESPTDGIPWRVILGSVNSGLGVVNLSAQIYADDRQANVYQPHIEPWNYYFHGPLPRTFQVIGGGTYTMPPGATVSFLFTWYSAAAPAQGGYAYLNCQYAI